MKTEKNIFIAFILNLSFSIFEFFGGLFTGSVAILSDALHDVGDAVGIGISFLFEKKSKRPPNENYTYGYARYSALGSLITTGILLVGSLLIIYNAILRIVHPTKIDYDGMLVFAVVGVCVNSVAAFFTHEGDSLNQRAVNLHMIEDVLGWVVVLLGAVVMRFTNFHIIDPLTSIGVALFILVGAFKNLKAILDLFLEKTPNGIDVCEIKEHLQTICGVLDVHHLHVWSIDGHNHYATMHVVTDCNPHEIKENVRKELSEHGIKHATIELETENEHYHEKECRIETSHITHHHHH